MRSGCRVGVALLVVAALAGCSGGGDPSSSRLVAAHTVGRVTQRLSPCPVHAVSPPVASTERHSLDLPAGAASVEVCGYSDRHQLRDEPRFGVRLDATEAALLVDVLDQLPVARQRSCGTRGLDGLLRFGYLRHPSVDVLWTEGRCDAVYVDGVAYATEQPVLETLMSIAGSYFKGGTGSAPEITGLGTAAARHRARGAHFIAMFGGQVIDSGLPAGRVMLQSPPAGAGDIGRQIEVLVSVKPALACDPSQLRLHYGGGQEGTGFVFGGVEVRDVSDRPCRILGPIGVVPLDASGQLIRLPRPMKPVVVRQTVVLTPTTRATVVQRKAQFGVTVGVELMGEYRDGPSRDGLCPKRDETTPAAWRLTIDHHRLTVPNHNTRSSDAGVPGPGSVQGCLGAINTDDLLVN
jgi:hypothetical protein